MCYYRQKRELIIIFLQDRMLTYYKLEKAREVAEQMKGIVWAQDLQSGKKAFLVTSCWDEIERYCSKLITPSVYECIFDNIPTRLYLDVEVYSLLTLDCYS